MGAKANDRLPKYCGNCGVELQTEKRDRYSTKTGVSLGTACIKFYCNVCAGKRYYRWVNRFLFIDAHWQRYTPQFPW